MPSIPQAWSTRQSVNVNTDALEVETVSLSNGNFVVLWRETSDTGAGTETGNSIIGRIFDPLGNPINEAFLAAPGGGRDNEHFEAKALQGGGFVIVYESDFAGTARIIMATELTAQGALVDTKQVAESSATQSIADPTVSANASGGYFVSYQQIVGGGGLQSIIHSVQTGSGGSVSGPALLTNVPSAQANEGAQQTTSAMLADGTLVVIGNKTANQQNNQDGLQVRFVDSESGTVLGSATQVPLTGINNATDTDPYVVALSTGGFVVAWRSENDFSGNVELRFQTYDENQVPQSNGNGAISSGHDYHHPHVVDLGGGAFFVMAVEARGNGDVVVGQMINATGAPIGTSQTMSPVGSGVTISDLEATQLEDERFVVSYAEQSSDGSTAQTIIYDPRVGLIDGHPDHNDVITAALEETIVRGDGEFGDFLGGGDDQLYAYGVGDMLLGQIGDDLLFSGSGADTLDGGAGEDTASFVEHTESVSVSFILGTAISGSAQDVLVNVENVDATAFNDNISGDNDNNKLNGLSGHDNLFGHGGQDWVYGGDGFDWLSGGDGDDILQAGAGDDNLQGGSGDDLVDGGQGTDWLRITDASIAANIDLAITTAQQTGHGEDVILNIENVSGTKVGDVLKGNSGANTLYAREGDDFLDGRAGNDELSGGSGNDTLVGGEGDDELAGNAGNDSLLGGAGNDSLSYGAGSDILIGGAGDDTYFIESMDSNVTIVEQAGEGNDIVNGYVNIDLRDFGNHVEQLKLEGDADLNGLGNALGNILQGNIAENALRGFGGADFIVGLAGDDTLTGGTGEDTMIGGSGADDMLGQGNNDLMQGNAGNDTMRGGHGNDTLEGGGDDDELFGQGNNDLLMGNAGNDTLTGAAGADTLDGGSGDDKLTGGNGADILDGGAGDDLLNGGAHADWLVFGLGGDQDTISGFQDNFDTIQIDAALADGLTVAQLLADTSITNQVGSHVVMDFGGGDVLRINNVGVSELSNDMVIM